MWTIGYMNLWGTELWGYLSFDFQFSIPASSIQHCPWTVFTTSPTIGRNGNVRDGLGGLGAGWRGEIMKDMSRWGRPFQGSGEIWCQGKSQESTKMIQDKTLNNSREGA